MKKQTSFCVAMAAVTIVGGHVASAQNTAPYWSLAGNANATTASKLGTTNGVSLRLYSGNVQRMLIGYSSGNVAIGTTSLTHKLTVGGNGRFTKELQVDNGGLKATNASGVGITGRGSSTGISGITDGYEDTDVGVSGQGYGYGVKGSGYYYGVYGGGATGVRGVGDNYGLYGTANATGVYGAGTRYGVFGTSAGTGVYGQGDENGVIGFSLYSFGVYGSTANTNSYAGYFDGDVFASGNFVPSDRSLKQNITAISSAMTIISKLQPQSYTFRRDGNFKYLNLPAGEHYGLIAEEIETLLPHLVKTTTFSTALAVPVTKTDEVAPTSKQPAQASSETIHFKALNYTELIPIIIKGMQEQAELIKQQQAQIDDLKNQLNRLLGNVTTVTGIGTLGASTPNPVRGSARIAYSVPNGAASAHLLLTDASGKTVRTIALTGSGTLTLNTSIFSSGLYHYSLVIDGKIIASRKLEVVR